MKLRFGIPLPGPFYLSGGGGRSRGGGGCATLLVAAMVIGLATEYPYVVLPVAGVAAVLAVAAAVARHKRSGGSAP